ncbi:MULTISPECIES: phosphoribosyltransferase [unclassified Breznakia]|uniref:ComF family protein n=1 Tax=unclassified Breznakia TaxID=2623764 RepID=UPI002406E7C4|nr:MULTISPECIES: phosphoribosyltransferase [unclassified Breznakia]MDF9838577.1 competence protein ComFC [Breznakia sp. PFB2-8]MDF9860610.1 competence protein ComFC [Breznakia sp. PH5-24]
MQDKCLLCFGDVQNGLTLYEYVMKQDCICGTCRKQFELCNQIVKIGEIGVYALYFYNDFFENSMFNYKENHDVVLAKIFLFPHLKRLKKMYEDYVFVFAPSSKGKEEERGFSSLSLLFADLKVEKQYLFEKTKEYKQSSQPYQKRYQVKDIIVRNKHMLPTKKILLVDDMCTSGATLKRMYELVKNHEFEVALLTIGINKKLTTLQ